MRHIFDSASRALSEHYVISSHLPYILPFSPKLSWHYFAISRSIAFYEQNERDNNAHFLISAPFSYFSSHTLLLLSSRPYSAQQYFTRHIQCHYALSARHTISLHIDAFDIICIFDLPYSPHDYIENDHVIRCAHPLQPSSRLSSDIRFPSASRSKQRSHVMRRLRHIASDF